MRFATIALCLVASVANGQEQKPENKTTALRVQSLAFSPDGKQLVAITGHKDGNPGRILFVDVDTKKVQHRIDRKSSGTTIAYALDGSVVAAAFEDGTALLLDPKTAAERKSLTHPKEVLSLAFGPEGKLATGCNDGIIRIWDSATGKELRQFDKTRQPDTYLSFSPDGKKLAGIEGRANTLWDIESGKSIPVPNIEFGTTWVGFSPDSQTLIVNDSSNAEIVFKNLATLKVNTRFKTKEGTYSTAYTPATGIIVTNSAFKSNLMGVNHLRIDGPTADEKNRIADVMKRLDSDSPVIREAAAKDVLALGAVIEPTLRVASKESTSAEVRVQARKLREIILNAQAASYLVPTENVTALALTADGKLLAVGDRQGNVNLIAMADGKVFGKVKVKE